ncbi:Rqc2 family fibronectin-binding protein [Tengunoibacter tsumagoiensis]|uniref:Fibronectin-binding protein A n=1 Tax=Tengunoibacter tsumagoiensis TaxID=2014871 RepID=A0A402A1R3_9CHLR|nr:NFACT RNA binding domain-containing protein [Tengunoibacter tsumagoiensis]GCE13090.1 fibronectin-binding protein A [Tengunoibacter tsumagoiensis]
MYVDAITLAAVADEWRKLLIGARIDTIIQPTEHAIALQCYAPGSEGQGGQNRWLYLSAHPQLARAHITARKPQKIASEPPPFVMLLRKHLEGARIEAVVQPDWERVVEIVAGYRSSPDSEERIRFRIIIEIMGRLSNIVFCTEEGLILGSLKRVGAEINRYRVISAGLPYVPPPPQQRTLVGQELPKLDPLALTAAQLSICAVEEPTPEEPAEKKRKGKRASGPPKLWELLSRHVLGCSPLVAREAVFRTTEQTEMPVTQADDNIWEELAWNVSDLLSAYKTRRWQPQMVEQADSATSRQGLDQGGQRLPLAFAAYRLEQYAAQPELLIRESPSINVILDDYYARAEWRDAVEGLRAPLRKILQHQRERCQRKAELLQKEMESIQEANTYRLYGDLLLAHQQEVTQGPTKIELQNYFGDQEETVLVPLDPRFDAIGNANRYFNKYHKLRRALELVPGQIEQNTVELATIEQLITDLLLAENAAEVALVKAEVQTAGYIRGKAALDKKALKAAKKGKGGKQTKGRPVPPGGGVPIHLQSTEGFTLLVGKNSRQNEEVTFHQATSNDMWLHARGVAGAHVIIKAAGREIPRATINQAASLAAYYSEARGSTSAPVDYTLQRHVRHMKGGGPGMVIYEREHTIYVEPDAALPFVKR